jgi:hypothetical protein
LSSLARVDRRLNGAVDGLTQSLLDVAALGDRSRIAVPAVARRPRRIGCRA